MLPAEPEPPVEDDLLVAAPDPPVVADIPEEVATWDVSNAVDGVRSE